MTIELELTFWDVVGIVVFVLLVGLVSGRILGVARGFGRATIAGVLGSIVGALLAAFVLRNEPDVTSDDIVVVGFGFALLATMAFSIGVEIVLRRRRPVRRPKLRTRIKTAFTIGGRLFEVAGIARRHGLVGPRLASKTAFATPEVGQRVRLFLEDCGGMFIKFGQIASTRADLLPPALVSSLTDLQSNVKQVPLEQVRSSLQHELGAPVEERFAWFSDEPLAAASIGQTHTAQTRDGQDVVVKVRRPDVEVGVARDAAVLRWASRLAERRSEAARALGLVAVSDELISSIDKELDYLDEAAHGRALRTATAHAGIAGVTVPDVVPGYTTEAVIVLERVPGRSVADAAAVDACAVPRQQLADRLLRCFLSSLLDDGVFHADPHPGNILVDPDGTLWLIDFGAVGIIDPVTLQALHLIGAGLGTREPGLLARGLRDMAGSDGTSIDIQALEAEVSRVLTDRLTAGGFDPATLQDIVALMQRQGLPVPPALTIIARALVTLEGTLRIIDPGMRLAATAADHLGSSMALDAASMEHTLQRELLRAMPSLRTLPRLVEEIGLQVRTGRIRIQLEPFVGRSREAVTIWVDQVVLAAVTGAGLLASVGLLVGAQFLERGEAPGALTVLGYVGLVLSSVMLMRVIAQVVRRQSESWRRT